MRRLTLYIFRNLGLTFLVAAAILTFAAWLSQSLRLVEVLVESAAPFSVLGLLLGLALPQMLAIVLPLALAGAVIYAYGRLAADSELVVMRAAGVGPLGLARPALLLALLVTAVLYALTLYFVPVSMRQTLDLTRLIRSDYASLLVHEGRFNALGPFTVYFRERRPSGELVGILVQDDSNPARPATMVADRGLLVTGGGAPRVVLVGGMRQEVDRAGHRLSTLYFDRYAVDLTLVGPDSRTPRLPVRARFLGELLHPNLRDPYDADRYGELVALGHQNLAWPLLPLGFAFVALGCLLSGETGRRGQSLRTVAAVLGVTAAQGALLLAANLTQRDTALFPAIYAVPAAAIATGLVLLYRPPRGRSGVAATAPSPA